MAITIRAKKDRDEITGKTGIRVLEINALTVDELPNQYIGDEPSVWSDRDENRLICDPAGTGSYSLCVGLLCSEEYFGRRMAYVRRAGERLKEVNEELREKARLEKLAKQEKAAAREIRKAKKKTVYKEFVITI
ncbi:MAG: hypothetical protein M0P69_05975 [Bacteroidales bacterium]|nr:hypothetical protein [Bacteroidales bacterium]